MNVALSVAGSPADQPVGNGPQAYPTATVAVTTTVVPGAGTEPSAYDTPVGPVAGVTDAVVTTPPTHSACTTVGSSGATGVHDAAFNVSVKTLVVAAGSPADHPGGNGPHA